MRVDAKLGTVAVYLNDKLVIQDAVSAFKSSRGKAALWMGGYSTETQDFKVQVRGIRVVRHKK